MGKFIDLTGKRFNRLTVLKRVENASNGRTTYKCKCICGTIKSIKAQGLSNGTTKSCGCFKIDSIKKRRTTHGRSRTRIYLIWKGMRQRCLNKSNPAYRHYGGRGIKISKRWMRFENFYKDVGLPPKGKSLDRINNNKGYSKNNCRWISQADQTRNRRNNVLLKINNKTYIAKEAAKILCIKYSTLMARLTRLNWSEKDALRK